MEGQRGLANELITGNDTAHYPHRTSPSFSYVFPRRERIASTRLSKVTREQ